MNRRRVARNYPNKTPPEIVDKILHIRRTYHMGSQRIAWYLERYDRLSRQLPERSPAGSPASRKEPLMQPEPLVAPQSAPVPEMNKELDAPLPATRPVSPATIPSPDDAKSKEGE